MNINYTILGGNLTTDPDTKFLPSGTCAGEFTVAVNERWKNDTGEKQEKSHFIRCFCFGKTAENIAKYFHKGERIIVEGSLSQDSWEDKETGKKREKTRLKVENFHFVDASKKGASSELSDDEKARRRSDRLKREANAGADKEGDTIPF